VSLAEFVARYGIEGGKTIWDIIEKQGVEYIRSTIKQHQIACDYNEEDSLIVASTQSAVKDLLQEADYLAKFGYSTTFIKKEDLPSVLGSQRYYGATVYTNSFGINAYNYCQAMKDILRKQGVEIYEETPVLELKHNQVISLHATVRADYVVVCADRFIPQLGKLAQEIYHVQNFLLASEVLTHEVIKKIFPQRKLMVWDTDLIYQFYRMTGDRLLIGGGSVWNAYDKQASCHNHYMYNKLAAYIKNTFPEHLIQFEHMWTGLIGVSKDIAPIFGRDREVSSIYYIGAAAGLPLAAMLGNYCADHILDGDDRLRDYFSPYRKFPIGGMVQKLLGTKLSFALSNWLTHGKT